MFKFNPLNPITYLITNGATTEAARVCNEQFNRLLDVVRWAVAANITLVQIREKKLTARALFELTLRATEITRGSETRLLVNDRADIARASGADGVHLTARSLEAQTVRRVWGEDFIVGVSVHSLAEARAARDGGADFATFGPVFDTPSKKVYGTPVGLECLREAASALAPFPLVALGGITLENARQALRAGACGVAAIRLFSDLQKLPQVVRTVNMIKISNTFD